MMFKEKEEYCKATFRSGGPYWHAYTSGKESPLIFSQEEDFMFVMNLIAQAASLFQEVRIIAFEVMNNYFHFVVSSERKAILEFWEFIRKRLTRAFPLKNGLRITLKPIGDLVALRNNIVYTNRNGYVADPAHTPFSYPWGTGRYYFLDWPRGKALALPIRLKVVINCFEHFNVLGLQKVPFAVDNPWFQGKCELTTYALDELVGTKLRALYQRKKGRDLFDLQVAFESRKIDVDKVLECYRRYIEFVVEKQPTYKQFVQNMELKMQDPEFLGDTDILLREGTYPFKPQEAYQLVKEQFIDKMPGKRD